MNEKNRKWVITVFAFMLLAAGIPGAFPVESSAAGKMLIDDITGDGRKDTIALKAVPSKVDNYDEYYNVYVNGKKALKLTAADDAVFEYKTEVLTFPDGKAFLFITVMGFNDKAGSTKIYKYVSGNLKCVLDLDGYTGSFPTVSLDKNRVTVETGDCFPAVGVTNYKVFAVYKNGKFRVERNFPVSGSETRKTAKAVSIYKKAGAKKKVCAIPRGKRVKLFQYIVKPMKAGNFKMPKGAYVKVKYKGKSGWMPLKENSGKVFTDSVFAG